MDSYDREFFRDLERMAAERDRIMREIDALSQRLEALRRENEQLIERVRENSTSPSRSITLHRPTRNKYKLKTSNIPLPSMTDLQPWLDIDRLLSKF